MGHPLVEEFCRANELQPWFFRRCQREFRDDVLPKLDERETLLVETAAQRAEIDRLKEQVSALMQKRQKVTA